MVKDGVRLKPVLSFLEQIEYSVPAEVRLDGGDDRERRDIEQSTESLQKDGYK
jgi:hypothetical protein